MPESLSCAVKWWRVLRSPEVVVGLFVCLQGEEKEEEWVVLRVAV